VYTPYGHYCSVMTSRHVTIVYDERASERVFVSSHRPCLQLFIHNTVASLFPKRRLQRLLYNILSCTSIMLLAKCAIDQAARQQALPIGLNTWRSASDEGDNVDMSDIRCISLTRLGCISLYLKVRIVSLKRLTNTHLTQYG